MKFQDKDKEKEVIMSKDEYFKKKKRDWDEVALEQFRQTDYPETKQKYNAILASFQKSIEELYYWCLNHWRYDQSISWIDKVTDLFTASENSSFFGAQQQKLGLQQDKVSQFLATIGKMVKEMFQLVRELRIIDERTSYYERSYSSTRKIYEPSEITLKGLFIDLAEGGAKNPSSVYGMSRELQFTTLPDLFFSIHPRTIDDVYDKVMGLEFNRKVKEVLQRKLTSYLKWKEETYKEIKNRRIFTLQYLRQHFDVIKMYMTWVKPYLRNVQRLHADQSKSGTPDLISAFEGSIVEIEILCRGMPEGNERVFAVVIQTFYYRTRPSMSFHQEGYHKGPVHAGETDIKWRAYTWTKEEIEEYLAMKNEEDFELLSVVDRSVREAMDALGDELRRYLKEAGEKHPYASKEQLKTEERKRPKQSIFEPFTALFGSGIKKVAKTLTPKESQVVLLDERDRAKAMVTNICWLHYKNFKKAFGFLSW